MIAKSFPVPENPDALRAAQSGDLCILLVSKGKEDRLLQHQHELQKIVGGRITSPVHVTVQRIEAQESAHLDNLTRQLRSHLLDIMPFPIHPLSFRSIYDPYRKTFILKWIARLSDSLQLFSQRVECAVHEGGYKSLYQPGWISTWITALEGIDNTRTPLYLEEIDLPETLFIGSEVIISRINGKNDYIFLDRFALNR